MSNNIVRLPTDYFPDPVVGRPIDNGSVFIGEPNTDPEVLGNRKTVILRQQDGTEVPITGQGQPLVTGNGGVILYNGSPVQVLTSGNYSIKVLYSSGEQAYYVESVLDGEPAEINQVILSFPTLAAAVASTSLFDGALLGLSERTTGNGGGAMWNAVLSSTVTENGFNIVQCTGVPTLSIVMRNATGQVSTDTVATMKSTDYIPGQLVKTSGYSNVLLGGGAVYLIKTVESVDTYGAFVLDNGHIASPRFQDGVANILQYGLVADGTKGAATGTDNSAAFKALIANEGITKITGVNGVFFFGALGLDEVLASRSTVTLDVDWGGAYLVVNGDSTIINTGMVFLRFSNINGSMRNYVFEDVGFTLTTSTGRGVSPVQIYNSTATTAGYEVGPCHVISGQSILTAFSSVPLTHRASDIRMVGAVKGDNVYYGVNLANSGDSMSGNYTIGGCNRALFVYGVKDCNVNFYCKEGQPSSSNLLISNSGSGQPKTENIKVRAHFGLMDGPLDIVDQSQVADPADGNYKNIDVTLIVDANGANLPLTAPLVNIGAFAEGGGFVASGTIDMDEVKLDIQTSLLFDNPVRVSTQSVNYGTIHFEAETHYNDYGIVSDFSVVAADTVFKLFNGNLTGITATLDSALMLGVHKNGFMKQKLTVSASNGFLGVQQSIATYDIIGKTSSSGVLTLQAVTKLTQTNFGSAPVFTIAASGSDLTVNTTAYSDSNAIMKIKSERL